jgi:hypothetical protein
MSKTDKMRCPHCNRVVDTFDAVALAAQGCPSRLWCSYGRELKPSSGTRPGAQARPVVGKHPVGLNRSASTPDRMVYQCHRKCRSNAWTVTFAWIAERVGAGADFRLPY